MDEKEQLNQALNRAYYFLKFRPRSVKEMREYLEKKAKRFRWDERIVDAAMRDLVELKLIDDHQFIEWFVQQRSMPRPKAIFLLKQRLRQFGVAKEAVDEYFEENQFDELKMAEKAVSSRLQQWKSLENQKRFQKLSGFLTRRGFRYDIIKQIIAKWQEEE